MKLSDNETNTIFFYVYSKNFRWLNPYDAEQFKGHPLNGNVYRASYNKDTKSYRVFVDTEPPMLIVIPSLKAVKEGYEGELIKITPRNIIDLKLPVDQLDKMKEWLELNNIDLKKELNFKLEPIKGAKGDKKDLNLRISKEEKEVTDFVLCASELYKLNYPIFAAIHEIMESINGTPPGESIDEMNLMMSPQFGAGLNVGRAFAALAIYISEDDEVNLNSAELNYAIYNLLNELARHQSCRIEEGGQ